MDCAMWRPPCPTTVGKALSSTPFQHDDRAWPASRMRGASNFDAAVRSAALHFVHDKIGTSTPRFAAASRSLTPTTPDRQTASVSSEQKEDQMNIQTARTQIWLAELASIQAEIAINGIPAAPRPARKRTRKLKPLWEE